MHIVGMLLEKDVLILAFAFVHLLPLDFGVDGVYSTMFVRVFDGFGVSAISEESYFGGEFGVEVGRIILIDKLEEVLPVPADLFVHLADVLHLANHDLLR